MMTVEHDYIPQILLIGNGILINNGGISWPALMDKISTWKDKPKKLHCPMPLQAVLVTEDHVGTAMKKYSQDFFGAVRSPWLKETLDAILHSGFDAVLTTNYGYELESAAKNLETISESALKKASRNIEKGKRAEPKYLLHTCNTVGTDGVENDIWHIHGEARKPNSMILGNYYYANLIGRMTEYLKSRGDGFRRHQEENKPIRIESWLDLFILGDVYILGFGMDYSEVDLWWLLERKKREKAEHGGTFYYAPLFADDKSRDEKLEKEKLLSLMGVTPLHCCSEHQHKSDENYRSFYANALNDIQNRMKSKEKELSHV